MALQVVMPASKTTIGQKLRWLECLRETLRREHNAEGDRFQAGEITEAEFRTYQREFFRPRNRAVGEELMSVRGVPKVRARGLDDSHADMLEIDTTTDFVDDGS